MIIMGKHSEYNKRLDKHIKDHPATKCHKCGKDAPYNDSRGDNHSYLCECGALTWA